MWIFWKNSFCCLIVFEDWENKYLRPFNGNDHMRFIYFSQKLLVYHNFGCKYWKINNVLLTKHVWNLVECIALRTNIFM